MSVYDLYGFVDDDLESTRVKVEALLGIKLVAHESSYLGEYYRFGNTGQENFILRYNYDEYDHEWAEDEHKDMRVILYVNRTHRSIEISNLLKSDRNIVHLKHVET